MGLNLAVVGAGVAGRLLALRLSEHGHTVTLYERSAKEAHESCSHAAAGMLAPYCELMGGEPDIVQLGLTSLDLWQKILKTMPTVTLRSSGTLVTALEEDRAEFEQFAARLRYFYPKAPYQLLNPAALASEEPDLASIASSLTALVGNEGYIDNEECLAALLMRMTELGTNLQFNTHIDTLAPHTVGIGHGQKRTYDHVFDCRGLLARDELQDLRGVKGEIVILHAPEVQLKRPIRLLHPRYPIYIVPRSQGHYLIGATNIESEERRGILVKSVLELLLPIYKLHPGFRFATVTGFRCDARPAFLDHKPRIISQPGLSRINGLYRHGFLLSPILVESMISWLETRRVDDKIKPFFQEHSL